MPRTSPAEANVRTINGPAHPVRHGQAPATNQRMPESKRAEAKIKLYNTLTRKKEVFRPLKGDKVRMYACGPTVYDYAHIGNLRTYIFEDLLRRALEYAGFQVLHVMNITDVGHLASDADSGEDKMEIGAKREKKTVWDIAKFYTDAFFRDAGLLHIKKPEVVCRATDHIKEMIELIQTLQKNGCTYAIRDGIYFDTSKLAEYGKLAMLRKSGLKAGARVAKGEKRNITDFALWKLSPKNKKRQMEWDSPWGKGFPGWHIECSAMAMKYLGNTLDIHCGGTDHIPVHHTNEIAQSEAATGRKFSNFWLHGGHMTVNGKKMSKSLSNYYRLEDLTKKGFDPMAFRYLCISSHYRTQTNFTLDALENARKTLENINGFFSRVEEKISGPGWKGRNLQSDETLGAMSQAATSFEGYMYDDLNTPEAVSVLFGIMHTVNRMMERGEIDLASLVFVRDWMLKINSVFQFLRPAEELNEVERSLVDRREQARKKGDFRKADYLREKLRGMGIVLEDTPHGQRWRRAAG